MKHIRGRFVLILRDVVVQYQDKERAVNNLQRLIVPWRMFRQVFAGLSPVVSRKACENTNRLMSPERIR